VAVRAREQGQAVTLGEEREREGEREGERVRAKRGRPGSLFGVGKDRGEAWRA
jgi:hypothetical protein